MKLKIKVNLPQGKFGDVTVFHCSKWLNAKPHSQNSPLRAARTTKGENLGESRSVFNLKDCSSQYFPITKTSLSEFPNIPHKYCKTTNGYTLRVQSL